MKKTTYKSDGTGPEKATFAHMRPDPHVAIHVYFHIATPSEGDGARSAVHPSPFNPHALALCTRHGLDKYASLATKRIIQFSYCGRERELTLP